MIIYKVTVPKFIRNIIFTFISCIIAVLLSADSGGTGDIYEMSGLIDIYLGFKCLIIFILALIVLLYGVKKNSISFSSVFWLIFAVLIFILNILLGQPINPPDDPRGWDYSTIKGSIIILYFDCFVGLIYTTVTAIYLFRKRSSNSFI